MLTCGIPMTQITTTQADPSVVAIGETGLDFNRNFSPPEVQLSWFVQHLRLAVALQKPLFVHEREAHSYLVEQLAPYLGPRLPPVVIHCFTGERTELETYVKLGFYIGMQRWWWLCAVLCCAVLCSHAIARIEHFRGWPRSSA